MNIASRTPEGRSGHCAVCGTHFCIEPSCPPGDAPCPACGCLVWFSSPSTDFQRWDSSSTSRDTRPFQVVSGPRVGATTVGVALERYQLFAACSFATASMTFLAAALAHSCWNARAVSEMFGWFGLCLLMPSLVCLVHSGCLENRQLTHSTRGRALDAVRDRGDQERTRTRGLVGRSSKEIQSRDSAILDHPMRDRLLDG
jgi:hypothetical protein